MGLSVVCALAFQVNWLKDSKELTTKNFEETIRQSMVSIMNVLEQEFQKGNIIIDGEIDTAYGYTSKDSLYSFSFYSVSKAMEPPYYDDAFYSTLEKFSNAIEDRVSKDTSLIKSVAIIYNQRHKAKKDFLQHINVDSLVRNTLLTYNIDLDFSYGFYDEKKSLWRKMGGKPINDTLNIKKSPFKLSSEEIPTLHLKLYKSESYLYNKMLSNIIISSLLALFVIVSFAYALRIIFKQKKLSQIKTDFINNMTHELKTPLATIGMAIATIEEPDIISNEEIVRQFTKVIKEENERMNKQIELVLNAAKEDDTFSKLKKLPLNLNDILEPIIEHNKIRIEQRKGKLNLSLNAQNTMVLGDEMHLYQAINNLLDNAIKYSLKDVDINISTINIDDTIQIIISDKGIGIDKKEATLIFEKFYRVYTQDVHNVKGFGLGLNYVKKIAMAHQGTVTLKHNTIGTSFIFTLPIDYK